MNVKRFQFMRISELDKFFVYGQYDYVILTEISDYVFDKILSNDSMYISLYEIQIHDIETIRHLSINESIK